MCFYCSFLLCVYRSIFDNFSSFYEIMMYFQNFINMTYELSTYTTRACINPNLTFFVRKTKNQPFLSKLLKMYFLIFFDMAYELSIFSCLVGSCKIGHMGTSWNFADFQSVKFFRILHDRILLNLQNSAKIPLCGNFRWDGQCFHRATFYSTKICAEFSKLCRICITEIC